MSKNESTKTTDWLAAAKEARSHGTTPEMCAALALFDIAESLRTLAKAADYRMAADYRTNGQ